MAHQEAVSGDYHGADVDRSLSQLGEFACRNLAVGKVQDAVEDGAQDEFVPFKEPPAEAVCEFIIHNLMLIKLNYCRKVIMPSSDGKLAVSSTSQYGFLTRLTFVSPIRSTGGLVESGS